MQEVNFIFSLAVLIMSVVVHEVSHGFVANILGDSTARRAGRLTLNPLKHLDPVGSFLVPVLTFMTSGFVFGWARPVPYNPYNLRDPRWGEAKVAAAGPLSNLAIAAVFGLVLRFALYPVNASTTDLLTLIVYVNIVLALFNLVPIPPLDGSRLLFSVLPYHMRYLQEFMERYWLVFIALFILFMSNFISPAAEFVFHLITGI
jgi:Zn-dependent protease